MAIKDSSIVSSPSTTADKSNANSVAKRCGHRGVVDFFGGMANYILHGGLLGLLFYFISVQFHSSASSLGITYPSLDYCNIPRVNSCESFTAKYLSKSPAIIHLSNNNPFFQHMTTLSYLGQNHPNLPLQLSTANTYTGREWIEMNLSQYLKNLQQKDFYLFGNTQGDEWSKLLKGYDSPTLPTESFELPKCGMARSYYKKHYSMTFGLAGKNTGVPFHFHGPGFNEVIHGAKTWFLFPPESKPAWDPDAPILEWVKTELPKLKRDSFMQCTVLPGELIYFPKDWLHATFNRADYNVFVATFA